MNGILVLKGEDDRAEKWITQAKDKIYTWVGGLFDSEGGYYESCYPSYFYALQNVNNDNQFNIHNSRLQKSIEYSVYFLAPKRDGYLSFDSADYLPGWMGDSGIWPGFAKAYKDGLAQWYYDYHWGTHRTVAGYPSDGYLDLFTAIIWYDENRPIEFPNNSPRMSLAKVFPGTGDVILRTGFESTDDIQFAMQCGHGNGCHSHSDQGGFILHAYGEPNIVEDSGYDNWQSEKHSIILIDGSGQIRPRSIAAYVDANDPINWIGSIDGFFHMHYLDYVLANNKLAYDKNSNNVEKSFRHILFIRPSARLNPYFIIIDDIKKDSSPYKYEWLLQSQNVSSKGNNNFIQTGEEADLEIQIVEPQDIQFSITTGNEGKLDIWPRGDRVRGTFFTLLYPTSSRLGVTLPSTQKITQGDIVGIKVGNEDLVLFNKGTNSYAYDDIQSDAQILARREINGSTLEYFFIQRGTTFSYNNQQLINSNKVLTAAAIKYYAQDNSIKGHISGPDSTSAYTIILHTQNIVPEYISFNGSGINFSYANGVATFTITGNGELEVNFCDESTCTARQNGQCGAGGCASTQRQQTRTCTDADCATSRCNTDPSCGGQAQQLTSDFNCDNQVDVRDFGILLSHWQKTTGINNYSHPQCAGKTKSLNIAPAQNSDGIINSQDLGRLLSCWGSSPGQSCWQEAVE